MGSKQTTQPPGYNLADKNNSDPTSGRHHSSNIIKKPLKVNNSLKPLQFRGQQKAGGQSAVIVKGKLSTNIRGKENVPTTKMAPTFDTKERNIFGKSKNSSSIFKRGNIVRTAAAGTTKTNGPNVAKKFFVIKKDSTQIFRKFEAEKVKNDSVYSKVFKVQQGLTSDAFETNQANRGLRDHDVATCSKSPFESSNMAPNEQCTKVNNAPISNASAKAASKSNEQSNVSGTFLRGKNDRKIFSINYDGKVSVAQQILSSTKVATDIPKTFTLDDNKRRLKAIERAKNKNPENENNSSGIGISSTENKSFSHPLNSISIENPENTRGPGTFSTVRVIGNDVTTVDATQNVDSPSPVILSIVDESVPDKAVGESNLVMNAVTQYSKDATQGNDSALLYSRINKTGRSQIFEAPAAGSVIKELDEDDHQDLFPDAEVKHEIKLEGLSFEEQESYNRLQNNDRELPPPCGCLQIGDCE